MKQTRAAACCEHEARKWARNDHGDELEDI